MCPVHDLSETEISGASSTFFNFEIKFFFNYRKPKYLQNILWWHWRYLLNRFFNRYFFQKITSKYLQPPGSFSLFDICETCWTRGKQLEFFDVFAHPKGSEIWNFWSWVIIRLPSRELYPIPYLRKAGKRICYFPRGYPHPSSFFLVRLKFVSPFITLWYTNIAMNNNKIPSTKTWTATKRIILGTKTPVQCKKKSTMR